MSNKELIDEVAKNADGYINCHAPRSRRVLEAMLKVDRMDFLPEKNKGSAYHDCPFMIGYGQTCSEPSMVAIMSDLLELQEGMKVLEIGTGCGYHAAVTSELVGQSGLVVSIERIPELKDFAESNLRAHFGADEFSKRLRLFLGDGSVGLPEDAPYDRIYLTAGIQAGFFNMNILEQQLKPSTILLFPECDGVLRKYSYWPGHYKLEAFGGVSFVPLIGVNGAQEK